MRVTVVTVGSRGDVRPYAALAVGLRDAGHDVRFATHAPFRPLVESLGLEFAPVAGDPQRMLETEEGRSWLESGSNPIAYMRRFIRLTKPLLAEMFSDIQAACEDADAVLYYARLAAAAFHVTEKLGVPAVGASTHPLSRTHAFPAVGAFELPRRVPFDGAYNLLCHLVAEQVYWQPFRGWTNHWRRDALGLRAVPFLGPDAVVARERRPVLYGYSPLLIPKPPDWGDWLHVTGFWFLDDPEWQPPDELADFLAAGPPPVAIGFGSMTDRDPPALAEMLVAALRRARRRGILLGGWGGIRTAAAADDIFQIDEAPHEWLFPRVAAVVHHGGVGTVGAALRAGVPSIAVPFFADQTFWGRRVARIGAGLPPIPRKHLSATNLGAAIERLTNDSDLRSRAASLGPLIRAERGVEHAVAAFEASLSRA